LSHVLVTGWAGYIGPVVVKRLKEAGHRVSGLDLGWFLPNYVTTPTWPDSARFADIREADNLPHVIVHLAGLSNDPLGDRYAAMTHDINEVGTLRLISLMPRARHVVISSCAVYGANDKVANEDTAPNPLTAYARAKANVDAALAGRRNVVSLRLGTVYGPSPGHRLDLVVNRMVYDAVHEQGVTISGSSWRPFTHIEDVAEAILRAVEGDMTGIRNVVGQNMRIDTLGRHVARATGAAVTVIDSPDKRDYRATTLYPKWMWDHKWRSVAASLPDLITFSRSLPGLPSRYERLATIKHLIETGRLSPELKEPIAA
jgi:nucleoside-diphosphate-sugar epimerase